MATIHYMCYCSNFLIMKMGKKYWKDALGLFPAAMVVPPTNNQKSQNSNNENKTVANISDLEFKTMNNSNPSITKTRPSVQSISKFDIYLQSCNNNRYDANRNSHKGLLWKKLFLKKFAVFRRKYLFNKVAGPQLYWKRDSNADVFLWILQNV